MTRVLLVDDDPRQLRLLARAIGARGNDISVLTAADGSEAIALLESTQVDLVLTDIQMPQMNGFDLVSWLLSHQPEVTVFTMTAYPDEESVARLRELGSVECFTKPLDLGDVLAQLARTVEQGVSGQIRNLSLASLLQLIEMERKTCTLEVHSGAQRGHLFIRDGQVLDARCEGLDGEEAAIAIMSWRSPVISISGVCRSLRQSVHRPVSFMVMEAMRLIDEAERAAAEKVARVSSVPPPTDLPGRTVSMFPAPMPDDAEAFLFVDVSSGHVRSSAGTFSRMETIATVVAEIYRNEVIALEALGRDDMVEVLLATPDFWALAQPISNGGVLAMVIFDPRKVNVVIERRELEQLIRGFREWRG